MTLPSLPTQGQDPWFTDRTNWDLAVEAELEGRLSEAGVSSAIDEGVGSISDPLTPGGIATRDVFSLSRKDALISAMVYVDFVESRVTRAGARQQLRGGVEGDGTVVRAGSNLLPVPFVGGSTPSTIPTGWMKAAASGFLVIDDLTADTITLDLTPNVNTSPSTSGLRTTDMLVAANTNYLLAFDVDLVSDDPNARVQVEVNSGAGSSVIRPTVHRASEGPSRAIVAISDPSARRIGVMANLLNGGVGTSTKLTFSKPMLITRPAGLAWKDTILGVPDYRTGTWAAKTTRVDVGVPSVTVTVAVNTNEAGWIVRNVTTDSAGWLDLSSIVPGGNFTSTELFVWRPVNASDYPGTMDQLTLPEKLWNEAPRYQTGWLQSIIEPEWSAVRTVQSAGDPGVSFTQSMDEISRATGGPRNNGTIEAGPGPALISRDLNRMHRTRFDTQLFQRLEEPGRSNRAEIELNGGDTTVPKGVDLWCGYWLTVDSTLTTFPDPKAGADGEGFVIVQQIRYTPNTGETSAFSPELSLRIQRDNQMKLEFFGDEGVVDGSSSPSYPYPDGVPIINAPWSYTPGVPMWIWMHIKYDPSHGAVELFVDGEEIYSNLDVPFGVTRTNNAVSRFGSYKWSVDHYLATFTGLPLFSTTNLGNIRDPRDAPPVL